MFLKNRNISSKIKRSKVTDHAALSVYSILRLSAKFIHVYIPVHVQKTFFINFEI